MVEDAFRIYLTIMERNPKGLEFLNKPVDKKRHVEE
jgi:hypothetical protein